MTDWVLYSYFICVSTFYFHPDVKSFLPGDKESACAEAKNFKSPIYGLYANKYTKKFKVMKESCHKEPQKPETPAVKK